MTSEGTLTFSDLYGGKTPGRGEENPEKDVAVSSGADFPTQVELARPAIFWVAFVLMLVAIRVLAKT